MTDEDAQLDELWTRYRDACVPPESAPEFMPRLWTRIEARRTFSGAFKRLSKLVLSASAVTCLLLTLLNYIPTETQATQPATYADALAADNSAERIYFTEAIDGSDAASDRTIPAQ